MNDKILQLLDSATIETGLNLSVKTFTPQLAGALLANSRVMNRNITAPALRRLARQMPEWVLNGEPIILGKNGDIYDGHHRLTVCRNDKINFTSVTVVLDSDDTTIFDSINTGDSRQLHSIIEMRNPNLQRGAALQQSVLSWLHRYCFSGKSMRDHGNLGQQYKWATNDLLLSQVITDFQLKAKELKKQLKPIGVAGSIYNAARYLGLIADPKATDEFLDGLLTGSGIIAEDPNSGTVFLARSALLLDKTRSRHYHTFFKFELLYTMLAWKIEQRQVGAKLGRFKPHAIHGAEPAVVKERLGFPVDSVQEDAA